MTELVRKSRLGTPKPAASFPSLTSSMLAPARFVGEVPPCGPADEEGDDKSMAAAVSTGSELDDNFYG